MTQHILRIDASARRSGSVSRDLADRIVARIGAGATVTTRDLADGVPLIDEAWIGSAYTPPADRTAEQRERLALSDTLVAELQAADTLVIGLPIYNFGVPAAFKAWIDQVARAGVTFEYSPQGPRGCCRASVRSSPSLQAGRRPVPSWISRPVLPGRSSASSALRTWSS
jgi:FMN-dependent NADH-azoreductase